MSVVVDVRPRQQIERMLTVVPGDGSQLKARKNAVFRGTLQYGRENHFVPLIKRRTTPLTGQIRLIHGTKVAVEIGHLVDGFAVGVASEQSEVIAEALFDF